MRPVTIIATAVAVGFSGLDGLLGPLLVSGFSVPQHAYTASARMRPACSTKSTSTSYMYALGKNAATTFATASTLRMAAADIAASDQAELEELRDEDPLGYVIKEAEVYMDMNSIINTGAIVLIAVGVLATLATVDYGMMRGWTNEEIAYRIPVDNWNSYTTVLNNSPVSTKAITSATVYSIGDVIAQRAEGATMGQLDRARTLRSMLAGLIGHGPLSHVWYNLSERLFDDVLGWTAWWSFFPKVVLDQTTWGPFWNNCYIALLGVMKRESWDSIWADVKRTTIPLVVSGLKLWPLAHCITYGVIPVENRLLWVDLVEIVWVTILATQAAGGGGGSESEEPAEKKAAN